MSKYKVTLTNIEWDVGKDPVKDGYDLEVIKNLPHNETCIVDANSEENALYFALDDITDHNGFCIQGYEKHEVEKLLVKSKTQSLLESLNFKCSSYPLEDEEDCLCFTTYQSHDYVMHVILLKITELAYEAGKNNHKLDYTFVSDFADMKIHNSGNVKTVYYFPHLKYC
ncbi:MAG: hypothetical protein RL621_338 [Bacteroidota bacterium]|jgi:hypothetical protein